VHVLALTKGAIGAIVVLVVFLLIWLGVFLSILSDRRAKTPIPANLKPYLDDDELETTRLERALTGAVYTLLFLAVAMGWYFVTEPGRQRTSFARFDELSVERGEIIYGPVEDEEGHPIFGAFGCQNCHGAEGIGGSTTFSFLDPATGQNKQVTWLCPPLNDVFYKYSEDEVRTILVYGRPGTPMPAWGTDGGGAMTPQQIEDVMNYLKSIQLSPEEVAAEHADDGKVGEDADGNPIFSGAELFNLHCARCHTRGWSYRGEHVQPDNSVYVVRPAEPGSGAFGPSLQNGAEVNQFPNPADHLTFIQEGDDYQKPYGVQGVGAGRMPGFGEILTKEQIQAIVDYERGL
jgi:mono/diheme cytochrome c family protein